MMMRRPRPDSGDRSVPETGGLVAAPAPEPSAPVIRLRGGTLSSGGSALSSNGDVVDLPTQLSTFEGSVPLIPEAPVDVEVQRSVSPASKPMAKKVKPKDLMHFSRQLGAFLRAGIPILDALQMLSLDAENPTLRLVLADVEASLRQGAALSECLDEHPKAFPPAYRSMVRSAEMTGNLDEILDRLAAYIERDSEARAKVKSALTYPGVIGALAVVVVIVLTTFVLPKFKPFFESLGAEMPAPTKALIWVADSIEAWWWLLVSMVAGAAAGLLAFMRSPRTRHVWDGLKLRIPALGDVLRFAIVERYCRVLSSMLQAGVPVPDAMNIAADAANNEHVRRRLDDARQSTMQGGGVSTPLAQAGVFPMAAVQMIRVGENTGSLDRQLEHAATFFERELTYKIKRFTTVFEPAVIIAMGLVVGFVAIALVSAMYGVFQGSGVR